MPPFENVVAAKQDKDRVLKHHNKIVRVKSSDGGTVPPPLMVASLKRLFGNDLLQVLQHRAFTGDEGESDKQSGVANLEGIIGNAISKGDLPECADAKDECPAGCQSCVRITASKSSIIALICSTTSSPPGTAKAPPGQKSF